MSNYTRQALATAFALSLLAGGAVAQQGAGAGRMGPPDNTPFKTMDTDGNGRLSLAEVDAWAEGVFGAMDSNSDGKLTLEEYMAVRMGPGASGTGNAKRQAQMQTSKAGRFKTMDTDHDGMVSHDEFIAAAHARFNAAGGQKGGVGRKNWMKSQ
ncbi:EF-hand domain-containing protein [Rhizobium sp. C4]|uniref:EF-hand domain-containing protein n=1 Tax=Rhizobium sp. C4 TaxID=1349800 RepID=UPI001E47D27A|nr:EF-hand domain-containing protein [Rhizobium sp. C4]MCD2171666.1 EF-hand domain-containing protein [Rhizobium sp. C4]